MNSLGVSSIPIVVRFELVTHCDFAHLNKRKESATKGSRFSGISNLAPPVGLEEVVQTLQETLKSSNGGNISDDVVAQLAEWAKLYARAAQVCSSVSKRQK